MKYFSFFTFLLSLFTYGQSPLTFDKRFVQSEDKWVAFPADSAASYIFGFIYIDEEAGLTLDYSGSFTIDEKGKYILKKSDLDGKMKVRLENNQVKVAHIPSEKFSELDISETPDWLHFYKTNENSVERQYKWGFFYNGWGECEKALEFLNKAYHQDPKLEGLRIELAYSHNCLKNPNKAIEYLMESLKEDVVTAYTIKELIYSHVSNKNVQEAEDIYRLFDAKIPDKTFQNENAYNILGGYYLKEDKENFYRWLKETKIDSDERLKSNIQQMIINLED
jgi:tetratricopeptide (TPR) repeat protein